MKQVSTKFKNQIKELGREIDSIITYYNHYKFITEDNQYILTEDGQKILTEQINRDNVVEITAEDIYNEKIITHGDILSTMMKEFDFEVRQEMQIGSIVNVKFGVKVDNEYEYIDYGDFIVNQKEYKEDTKTYSYKAYDFMLLTMTPFKAPDLSEVSGEYTIYDLFNYICSYCHLNNGVEMFANSEREYYNVNSLEELGYTNRDILDFISEISGSSIACIDYNLVPLTPNNTIGSNLFSTEWERGTINGSNGSNASSNASIRTKGYIKVEPNKIYSMSRDIATSYMNVRCYGINKNYLGIGTDYITLIKGDISQDTAGNPMVNNSKACTISPKDNVYYLRFNDVSNDLATKYMIVESDTFPTFYEPYGSLYLYEDSFKDTNVNFNKVYGPVNSILFSRSDDTDVIEIKDDESIATNGVTQIKIKDNPFLEDNDRSDYQEELFDVLNGLTYTLNDLDSIGITYLDYYDKYKVQIGENTYDCLLLNDEISINQGLEEKIFTEEYEGAVKDYVTSTSNIDDVSLRVDKANKQIVLKVDSNGKLAQAELKQNADSGTEFNVKADNINLEGYTTINGNFSVDLEGNMSCKNTEATDLIIRTTGSDSYTRAYNGGLKASYDNNEKIYSVIDYSSTGTYVTDSNNIGVPKAIIGADWNGSISNINVNNSWGFAQFYSPNSASQPTINIQGNTGNITCVSLTQTSHVDKKKNFKKFENALDILKDVDIYSYNFKNEENYDKKHIGFVIGDDYKYRREITDKKNENVELYSMISVLWQAVKEQQEEIEKLKERIDNK